MYVTRQLSEPLALACTQFPAVLVTGPRQSGKTTLLRQHQGPAAGYVSFDDPLEREFARQDPEGLLDRFGDAPVILDEIQYVPELLPYIKVRIDRQRQRNGKWLLTGSQQFGLMKGVSESLAGRVAILDLLPFSMVELEGHVEGDLAAHIWRGAYPDPALHPDRRDLWMRSYTQTYLERDVRQLQDIRDLRAFEQFLGLCAARHGQESRMAPLARDCGISQPTAKSWATALDATYITVPLPPYFRNFGKRLIKAPKRYFLDSGLACTLTRQPSGAAALSGPMGGALLEGWVVAETWKAFAARGRRPDAWYWRSHDGLEVDLLVQLPSGLLPVEIKLTHTPRSGHTRPLLRLREVLGDVASERVGVLVCRVSEARPLPGGVIAMPWHEWPHWLTDRLRRA